MAVGCSRIIDHEDIMKMVWHVLKRPEFKEELLNGVKDASKEGAKEVSMEVIKEFLQSIKECRPLANSSSQTPAEETVSPSSAVGTNAPASIKGSPCINNLQLRMKGDIESRIYTNSNLGKRKIQVELRDLNSGSLVFTGHEAEAELVVGLLDGSFEKRRGLERGMLSENRLIPRGTRSLELLKGCTHLTLERGVCELPEGLVITDSSSMVSKSSGKFCLSVFPSNEDSSIKGVTSNAFTVLDRRGKVNKKSDSPDDNTEVWRLVGIRKNGQYHNKLKSMGIRLVPDLVKSMEHDRERFKEIFKHDFNKIEKHLIKYKSYAPNHMEMFPKEMGNENEQGMGSDNGALDKTTMNQPEGLAFDQGLEPLELFNHPYSRHIEVQRTPIIHQTDGNHNPQIDRIASTGKENNDVDKHMMYYVQPMQEHGYRTQTTPMEEYTYFDGDLSPLNQTNVQDQEGNHMLLCLESCFQEHSFGVQATPMDGHLNLDEEQIVQIETNGQDHIDMHMPFISYYHI